MTDHAKGCEGRNYTCTCGYDANIDQEIRLQNDREWRAKLNYAAAKGFYEGLMEAARTLRKAGADHKIDAEASKKVLEGQAHELAAALLSSWANGIEINADVIKPGETI